MNTNDTTQDYPLPPKAQAPGADPLPPRRPVREVVRKSPGLAALLSLMPGMGQVYLGFYRHGFAYMGIVALLITILNAGVGSLEALFGFSLSFFWIYNMIDAHRLAKMLNRAMERGEELDIGAPIKLPETGGSLFGGVVLIIVGLLLLLNLKFDVSLVWLEEWWPVAPIALGVYLVVKSIKARHSGSIV
ncbi:hypothetical protein JXA88_18240 [Candidatus Fermentibacteria bacterium]|nr:hypothetical protein [Candidatus Fermentibacteria bacterium]